MFNIPCIHIAHQVRSVYAMGINMLGKYNKLRNVDPCISTKSWKTKCIISRESKTNLLLLNFVLDMVLSIFRKGPLSSYLWLFLQRVLLLQGTTQSGIKSLRPKLEKVK